MSILKPGMRCILVGEDRGCEANIGALVTITQLDDVQPPAWLFKDATRPLVMLDCDLGTVLPERVVHSYEGVTSPDEDCYSISARHLVPIKGDGLDSEPPKAERDLPKDPATLAWARSVVEKTLTA